ncbi:MAG: MotA/TolQ/ExbB proton channel family protein [Candidatus Lambdaproteobacteria bacterium]|nr:MotA/TolQ/ExbB proton channel family protein [Candidatus Lambdaproteobacteria bacterium]
MIDRLGTLVGFLIGATLIVFGITWPDQLSNYYVYQINQYENTIGALKEQGATRNEIEAVAKEEEAFKNSFEAGITRFVDLKSFLIVFGGSYAATLIAFPFRRAIATLVYMGMVFAREKSEWEFETVYKHMVEFAELRFRKQMIPDEKIAAIPLYFLRDALENFIQVDWVSEEMVTEIINSEIESYAYNADQEINVMEYMGRVAPAFGMLGTVVGLILMMGRAAGENASIVDVMGGMSVALITTLYGVLLAQLIFLPVAAKLTRNKESYVRLYDMIREGTIYLHRRERPDVIEQDLQIYLSKRRRLQIQAQRRAEMAGGLKL